MPSCRHCSQAFETTDRDQEFLEKLSPAIGGKKQSLPPPTLCPRCRQQRRWSFRNERVFYHRKCDLTGKQLISIYPSGSRHTVYDAAEWWSDRWDPLSYGQPFDSSRTFFEQFHELLLKVPRLNLFGKGNENSMYTNHTDQAKNSYLCIDVAFGEDVFYSKYVINGKNCVDCFMTSRSELCYETTYTEGYNCIETHLSTGVSDSAFLYNCKGCHHCLLCWNLRDKSYCIENKQYSKEEYERKMHEVNLGSYKQYAAIKERFESLLLHVPRQAIRMINAEDCVGTCQNSKSVTDSFDMGDCRDCRYCYDCVAITDCMDVYESGFQCELQYETHACNRGVRYIGCNICYDSHDLLYCDLCHNSHDLFGCVGLRQKEYCILNKQYTKEEYEELVPKLIAHMRSTGEWGEFFPVGNSPYAYNETIAQDECPLTKEKVLREGWQWYEEGKPEESYMGPSVTLPDDIMETGNDVLKKILTCARTGRHFKLIAQELEFYRRMRVPVPRLCPDERYRDRMKIRGPQMLWARTCMKCGKDIRTTYAPERPEIVYCNECYLASVY
jgi:hypothetical protein